MLDIIQSLYSWVHDVEPHWWDCGELVALNVLKWHPRGFVKSAEDLVRSEGVFVVVRVALNTDTDCAGKSVPTVHFVN